MDKKIEQQLINPANSGGAPLYVEDMVRLQQHAQSLSLPMLKHSAEIAGFTLPILDSGTGGQEIGRTKAGFYVTPPSFELVSDDNTTASVVVSEFTAYIDGKLCVYNGGTLDFISFSAAAYDGYFVEVGNELKETRVFRDGVNRELFITHEVKLKRVPFNQIYGLTLGASHIDAHGVFLAAKYNDTVTDQTSNFYPLKHPNCAWDSMGLNEPITKAYNAVSKNDANVSGWATVTMNDGTGYTKGTADIQVRSEGLNESLRLRGLATYTVTSSNEALIGTFPFTKKPSFEQIVQCIYTDTNETGFVKFKSNGEIWAKINVGGGQNATTFLFDGITIVGS